MVGYLQWMRAVLPRTAFACLPFPAPESGGVVVVIPRLLPCYTCYVCLPTPATCSALLPFLLHKTHTVTTSPTPAFHCRLFYMPPLIFLVMKDILYTCDTNTPDAYLVLFSATQYWCSHSGHSTVVITLYVY